MEQELSPYEPPKTDVEAREVAPTELVPATRLRRMSNMLIDYLAMGVLAEVVIVLLRQILGEQTMSDIESAPDFVFAAVLFSLYYTPLEALTGRTLGKLITGTKVVSEDGGAASFARILGRTLCRLVPLDPISFLGVDARGWHDRWSKTRVVKCR